jgi:hypothetical protein
VEDLHARLTEALPGLREAIFASPPIYLQGVRRLLAESESDNVGAAGAAPIRMTPIPNATRRRQDRH